MSIRMKYLVQIRPHGFVKRQQTMVVNVLLLGLLMRYRKGSGSIGVFPAVVSVAEPLSPSSKTTPLRPSSRWLC